MCSHIHSVETQGQQRDVPLLPWASAGPASERLIPLIYFAITLPVALYLCFLIPPMQIRDEGRHFLRACQIADGRIISQIEASSGEAGGMLPLAESEFVRDKMGPAFLVNEDRLPTIRARLEALNRASTNQAPLREKKFAVFPDATIYSPALYLPQITAIRITQLFSDKVYVWFYSARVLNALVAILLVFVALRIAKTHQLLLLVPAVLPMSLYQISSVSSDAMIIGLSIVFVALCIRFVDTDGLVIRAALVVCLCLLVWGKPVHLPMGLLLLAPYSRLGWRRAIAFCAAAMAVAAAGEIWWSYLVRHFFALGSREALGHDPAVQMHFAIAHPILMAKVILETLWYDGTLITFDLIGNFGWGSLALPAWLYTFAIGTGLAILLCILINLSRDDFARLALVSLTAAGLLFAVLMAAFILWTPVGHEKVYLVQGRYLLPVLAVLASGSPPLKRFGDVSRAVLPVLSLALFLVSCFWTVRVVKNYYFSHSNLQGRNIQEIYSEAPSQSCPASLAVDAKDWFSVVETGRTTAYKQNYRVILSGDDGTILGESDPALIGGNGALWRLHTWNVYIDRFAKGHLWFAVGKSACHFADIEFRPFAVPSA
jgi:uncharacterized membrane protein